MALRQEPYETLGPPLEELERDPKSQQHNPNFCNSLSSVGSSVVAYRGVASHAEGRRSSAGNGEAEEYCLYDVVTPEDSPNPRPQGGEDDRGPSRHCPQGEHRPPLDRRPSTLVEDAQQQQSIQVVHRLALQRIMELEQQLHERSEQLAVQQQKVESSKGKILDLTSAVQVLKKKIESTARRSNGLAPDRMSQRYSTVSVQTDDGWLKDWEIANAALHDLCASSEADASKWRESASIARNHAAELVAEVKKLTTSLTSVTNERNRVRDWGQALIYRCLSEENREHREDAAALWERMSETEAAAYLDAHGGEGVLQLVAALSASVEPPSIPDEAHHGGPSPAISPRAKANDDYVSPVRRIEESRSLLEELARASSAAAAAAVGTGAAVATSGDDATMEVRAIELRLDALRRALDPTTQLPAALRCGIEEEIRLLQQTLEHLATGAAAAIRVAYRKQNRMHHSTLSGRVNPSPQRGSASPRGLSVIDMSPPTRAVYCDEFCMRSSSEDRQQ